MVAKIPVKNGSVVQINQMVEKVNNLDDSIVRLENKLYDKNYFQHVTRGNKIESGVSYTRLLARNKFQVLEDEVRQESDLMFVGDSLIRHQTTDC